MIAGAKFFGRSDIFRPIGIDCMAADLRPEIVVTDFDETDRAHLLINHFAIGDGCTRTGGWNGTGGSQYGLFDGPDLAAR